MAHSFAVNIIHLVFAVKYRQAIINKSFKNKLEKFFNKIIQERKSKLIEIYARPDHVHLLIDLHRTYSIAKFTQEIKAVSSKFINDNNLCPGKFEWQTGYGAFSVSRSLIKTVRNYIRNQEQHHQKQSFHDEYVEFLKNWDIDINPDFIFNPLMD